MLETRLAEPNYFVGLTYADEHLPTDGLVSKRALQLLFKRMRRHVSFRYFAVGEYGGRYGRPHYHALLFGLSQAIPSSGGLGVRHRRACPCIVCSEWGLGQVHAGEVTPESCAYVAGYVEKGKLSDLERFEFSLMSRNPGIGSGAVPVIYDAWRDSDTPGVLNFAGKPFPVGRFLRSKLDAAAGVVKKKHVLRTTVAVAPKYLEELRVVKLTPELAKKREAMRVKHGHSARARSQIRRSRREKG